MLDEEMPAVERIEYMGWTVEVQRKAFRRRVSIVVKPRSPVIVKAGKLTSLRSICEFLESRRDWVEKNLRHFAEHEKLMPPETLVEGAKYPYFGRELILKISVTPGTKIFFSADEENLTLYAPIERVKAVRQNLSLAHEALREFYHREGARVLTKKLAEWAERSGLQPTELRIREAKTRWGSCHPRGTIFLNWRLAVFRPEIIDYVVVHELAHLRQPNHSSKFWDLVEEIMPDYKEPQKEIRKTGFKSDFLQRQKA